MRKRFFNFSTLAVAAAAALFAFAAGAVAADAKKDEAKKTEVKKEDNKTEAKDAKKDENKAKDDAAAKEEEKNEKDAAAKLGEGGGASDDEDEEIEGEKGKKKDKKADQAAEVPNLLAVSEEVIPNIDAPLNRNITIKFKCPIPNHLVDANNKPVKIPGCNPKVVSGKLLAIFEEEVPAFTTDKRTWIPLETLSVAEGVDEKNISWNEVLSIKFDFKFQKERMENHMANLISCATNLEVNANRRECSLDQQYNATKKKGKSALRITTNSKVMFVIETSKGKTEKVQAFLGKIKVDNRKLEDLNESSLSKLLINEYNKGIESIELK